MARTEKDIWASPAAILSRFDADADGTLDYVEFRALCVQLFGTDEVKGHEGRVREIYELFDVNGDGTLNEEDLRSCYEWIRATVYPVNVLLIVDVQNDFIDGTLALRKCGYGQEGTEVVEPINRLLRNGRWSKVIYSQDWHPEDHISFFDNLGMRELHPESKITKKMAKLFDTVDFLQPHVTQILWPKHCVMNTWGAELHKDLLIVPSSERVHKGQHPDKDVYSVFNGKDIDGASELVKILMSIGCTHLYVCGIAYDVCVKETCLDGLQCGYRLAVVDDCCRGVKPDDITIAKNLITENGGLVASSDQVLSLVNEDKRSLIMAHHAARSARM
ncbi:pyrazinamidase nicotinamidase [Lasius niger]|uniref:nicotinamidase n=1 Tax=Lasius niger TaxID=67767 RepID=A0A0J7KVR2_LASNI|nr:pyrazinamidase nicotinamidase [Lasius niger]